jgi:1,4-dihydroxy-2-naphthoyl-CoA hydrolase
LGIWKRDFTPAGFEAVHADTLPGLLGVRLVEVGPDFARAAMAVDERHIQPAGILHGGASVVLAETIGSVCGVMALPPGQGVVGVEVSASHLSAARGGDTVTATCRPLRLGRTLQVWEIEIRREDGTLTCVCRLTTAVRAMAGG